MLLKFYQIRDLYNALVSLDGYNKLVHINDKKQVTRLPYEFSRQVRRNIAKNIKMLQVFIEALNQEQDETIKKVTKGKAIIHNDSPEFDDYTKSMNEFLILEEEVKDLIRFKLSDLLGEEGKDVEDNGNPIPGSILATLYILVDE